MLNVLDLKKGQKIFVVDWNYQINEREVIKVIDRYGGRACIRFRGLKKDVDVTKYVVDFLFYTEKEANEYAEQEKKRYG